MEQRTTFLAKTGNGLKISFFFLLFILVKGSSFFCWVIKKIFHSLEERKYREYARNYSRKSYQFRNEKRDSSYDRRDSDYRKSDRKKHRTPIEKIAFQLCGEVEESTREPSIVFNRDRVPYRAFVTHQHGAYSIRLLSTWPNSRTKLEVYPDKRRHKNKRRLRETGDLKIGNSSFDRSFIVQSSSKESAKSILSRKACKRIQRHSKHAFGRFAMRISGGRVEFGGKATRVFKRSQIVAIIKSFVDIHQMLLDSLHSKPKSSTAKTARASEGISFVTPDNHPTENDRDVMCMVCGHEITKQRVDCRLCETPHHKDCWKYFGKCSTYGCHSRKTA